MTRSILTIVSATSALVLSACGYNEEYNNAADYNASDANYSANEAEYGNAADYNATNTTYGANDMNAADAGNEVGNATNTADNMVTNAY